MLFVSIGGGISSGGVCLVMASTLYDPKDYYHDYDEFVAATRQPQK